MDNQIAHGYVVSISARGTFRRLHFAGSCWRVPGLHYLNYEVWGEDVPTDCHARCRDCFPAEEAEVRAEDAELPDESDGSSADTSSDESAAEDELSE